MEIRRIQIEGPDGEYGLSYADWGSPDAARTIVCVHGLGGSHVNWMAVAPGLARLGHVTAPDLPGFGSPLPDGWTATKEEYVDWLIAEVEKAGEEVQ